MSVLSADFSEMSSSSKSFSPGRIPVKAIGMST